MSSHQNVDIPDGFLHPTQAASGKDLMDLGSFFELCDDLVQNRNGHTQGDLDLPGQTQTLVAKALELLAKESGGVLDLEDGTSLFVEVYPAPPRLIVIGAVHIAQPLMSIATVAGFDTIVVDPLRAFATRERFPHATDLVQAWPQRALPDMALNSSAYLVVLTHDPKLDDPALEIKQEPESGK